MGKSLKEKFTHYKALQGDDKAINQEAKNMEESKLFKENMKSFGEYEPYVRKWCKKHDMGYIMIEFKELFDSIRVMDEKN